MATTYSSTSTASNSTAIGIGGVLEKYLWNWEGQQVSVVYETLGTGGSPVLLLPAFSTVSTRAEMRGLADLLAPRFQVVALDWPGFGQSDRPPLDYRPAVYHQFLQDFVNSTFNTPVAVVAAGHSAGYVMRLANLQPQVWSLVVLVAPTWKGPLLAAMGEHRGWYSLLRQLVRSPILGQFLYKLNTTPSFLRLMYRRHVYADPSNVTDSFIQQKWPITQESGARFAPAAFVTGALDPARDRSDFLVWFEQLSVQVLAIVGEQTPPKSRAEMDVLARLDGVRSLVLPGSLGMHEEHPEAIAPAILDFLSTP